MPVPHVILLTHGSERVSAMPGQIVKLEGDALGYHLKEGKGWQEGYVVILNLAMLHRIFATREEAQEFANSLPAGWEPEWKISTEEIPK
jgi:hypothetical protein